MFLSNGPMNQPAPNLWKIVRRGDLIAVFFVALTLRLILLAAGNDQAGTNQVLNNCFDCNLYLNMAKSIAYGIGNYENGFFYFGPGYACFLALIVPVFQSHVVPIILVNIFISSLSCLLIYVLAMKLTRSYAVAIVAALLAATSYTSIALSCLILSDTFYFFIFILALLIYLEALESGKWVWYILAGIMVGVAALIRSVGQFWPVVMIIIAVASYMGHRRTEPFRHPAIGKFATQVAVAIIISVTIMSVWMVRNHRVHGVYSMAITSAIGPANLAAIAIERRSGKEANETMQGWVHDYLQETGESQIALGDQFRLYVDRAEKVADSLGWWTIGKTYLSLVWKNLNEISYHHRLLIPKCDSFTIPIEYGVKDFYLNYANFVFSMLGLVILIWRRRYRIAVILGSVYCYYAAMIGSLRWQGSRYFFPGQIAWAILVAISLVFLIGYIVKGLRYLFRHDASGS